MVVDRVTAAAGVLVGLLHRLTHLPDVIPGLIADLQDEHVDPAPVPAIVAVSAVSLIGGAAGTGEGPRLGRRRRRHLDLPAPALSAEDSKPPP